MEPWDKSITWRAKTDDKEMDKRMENSVCSESSSLDVCMGEQYVRCFLDGCHMDVWYYLHGFIGVCHGLVGLFLRLSSVRLAHLCPHTLIALFRIRNLLYSRELKKSM